MDFHFLQNILPLILFVHSIGLNVNGSAYVFSNYCIIAKNMIAGL